MTAQSDYLLHLADNALVLGQRNAEWCGHGPVLEEDIAMANISLDLVGQARMLYQHAASLIGNGATEDSLAYFRDAREFRNFTLLELPHHGPLAATAAADRDYAVTITRNFLYSAHMLLLWDGLQAHEDAQLAAIAAKSLKETRYHLRHARDWLLRLGDGTDASHARMQAALDHLMPYTQEFWSGADARTALDHAQGADAGRRVNDGIGVDDRAGMDGRTLGGAKLGLPQLGQAGKVKIGVVGDDAGAARHGRRTHGRGDDDAAGL